MFGDVGHGLINTICSMLLIIFEKKLSNIHNDMFTLIFAGRYVIFLMSIFSIIVGLIYNDFFALGFNCFKTKYEYLSTTKDGTTVIGYTPTKNTVYNFGLDSIWHWSTNSMVFVNSFKMKMSVVVGVSQMVFGLILKLINLIL